MILLSEPWLYFVLVMIAGMVLLNIGITGTLASRYRPIVIVKSVPLRIAFFVVSVALFAFLIWMTKQQIAAGIQYFNQSS
jgi:hypothetical protein